MICISKHLALIKQYITYMMQVLILSLSNKVMIPAQPTLDSLMVLSPRKQIPRALLNRRAFTN